MQTFNLKFQVYFIRNSVLVKIDIFMFMQLMVTQILPLAQAICDIV